MQVTKTLTFQTESKQDDATIKMLVKGDWAQRTEEQFKKGYFPFKTTIKSLGDNKYVATFYYGYIGNDILSALVVWLDHEGSKVVPIVML